MFHMNYKHGKSKLYEDNMLIYDGDFYNNSKEGHGILYYKNTNNILYDGVE